LTTSFYSPFLPTFPSPPLEAGIIHFFSLRDEFHCPIVVRPLPLKDSVFLERPDCFSPPPVTSFVCFFPFFPPNLVWSSGDPVLPQPFHAVQCTAIRRLLPTLFDFLAPTTWLLFLLAPLFVLRPSLGEFPLVPLSLIPDSWFPSRFFPPAFSPWTFLLSASFFFFTCSLPPPEMFDCPPAPPFPLMSLALPLFNYPLPPPFE